MSENCLSAIAAMQDTKTVFFLIFVLPMFGVMAALVVVQIRTPIR